MTNPESGTRRARVCTKSRVCRDLTWRASIRLRPRRLGCRPLPAARAGHRPYGILARVGSSPARVLVREGSRRCRALPRRTDPTRGAKTPRAQGASTTKQRGEGFHGTCTHLSTRIVRAFPSKMRQFRHVEQCASNVWYRFNWHHRRNLSARVRGASRQR